MGRRPRTFQPNAVLESAIYSGLSSLVRLARGRVRSKTERHYKNIDTNWRKACTDWEESRVNNPYDYSSIQNAEPNLRGAFFKILWKTTKRYGNTENKRVYSWEEGTVGPLNILLNYTGARLRDLALTYYQFPKPDYYEIRVYPDKSTKVYPLSVAEKYPDSSSIKTYTKAGYPGNQHGPRILLSHPTLPELDFVDMIRAHLIELCKQLFIYNVPRTEAYRYIRLLIHRLRPYLDWVYTQRKIGKKNFNPESDMELRKIKQEIKALYGRNVGRQKAVSRNIEREHLPDTAEKFRKKIAQRFRKSENKDERKRIRKILDLIDQEVIVDRDVEKFNEQVLSLSQREGNDWHRILLSDLHHPASLKQVVFAGDKMLEELSPVLIVGELPVGKGTGQIDITFFLRREILGRIILTPILILEIKSKTGFNYNLYSVRARNKKKKDYGPRLHASKRRLSDDEWNTISKAMPAKTTVTQLDIYEKLLVSEYRSLVPSDSTPPEGLWKGVIVLDTDQNPLEVFEAFKDLLVNLTMGLVNNTIDSKTLTSYIPDSDNTQKPLRLALLLTPSKGPSELISEMKPLEAITEEDPFQERVKDERIFTLYVSISSSTSSGNAASWLSRNWHLLHHLHECIESSTEKIEIFWLDLMGVFKTLDSHDDTKQLINRRFGLDELFRERYITKKFHKQLTALLKDIEFVDLSPRIDWLLEKDSPEFANLIDLIQTTTQSDDDSEKIIVLDGWGEFRNLVPREHRQIVTFLERTILDILPEKNTNIIWIDSGIPHTQMNPSYQRKCIKPLPHNSHRRTHLDEIIYNIPSTPRVFGWRTPRREDARIIIQDTPTSANPWSRTIDVPLLRNFAKRVRGVLRRDGLVPEEYLIQTTHLKPMYGHGVTLFNVVADLSPMTADTIKQLEQESMTLVPSVLRQRTDKSQDEEDYIPRHVEVESITTPMDTVPLTERLILCPKQPPPYLPKAKEQYYEANKITRGWCYDSFPKEIDEVPSPVSRPPIIESGFVSEIDTAMSRELELKRLLYTAKFLMRALPDYEDLYHCCERVVKVIKRVLSSEKDGEVFLRTLRDVKGIIQRESGFREIWDSLAQARSELLTLLNFENREILEGIIRQTPDLLELYGNNLFLTVCAVIGEFVQMEQQLAMTSHLWSVVAEWILHQLGFRAQQSRVKTKYDLQAIYSNLRIRTKLLLDKIHTIQKPKIQDYGQILWSEDEGLFSAWIIFQDTEEMVGGLVGGLPEPMLYPKWYDCIKNQKDQRDVARQTMNLSTRTSIIIQQHEDLIILWIPTESDDELVWLPFELEYPANQSRTGVILPWLKISEVPITNLSEIQHPTQLELPSYVKRNVNWFLQSVIRTTNDPIKVTCLVSVNAEQETYEVGFYEDRNLIESLEFKDTKSLVKTLRHPIRVGSGLETADGKLLMWDHRKDIEYIDAEVKIGKETETLSLSVLKPLVHRSKFFPEEFYVPETCRDLLATLQGDSVIMRLQADGTSFKSFRVEFDDMPASSSLRLFETLEFNIFDLALLAECQQLFDPKTRARHHVELDAKALYGFRFSHIDRYPRLKDAVSALTVEDFDWSRESWKLSLVFPKQLKGEIYWSVVSLKTRERWSNNDFVFKVDARYTLTETITAFMTEVSRTIPLKHVEALEDTLEGLKNTLIERGLSDESCARTAKLELTETGICIVIYQQTEEEDHLEIDRLYVDRDMLEDYMLGIDDEYHPLVQYNVENLDELGDAVSMYLVGEYVEGEDD